jgi:hypothetical protein
MRRAGILCALIVGASAIARAQEPSTAPPPWYLYARTGVHSPLYAYLSRSFGHWGVIAGGIYDRESGYREFGGGAGLNLYAPNGNGTGLYAIAAGSSFESAGSGAWYAEAFTFPTFTVGRLNLTGFIGGYLPLDSVGLWQVYADPITALYRLPGRRPAARYALSVGASYTVYKTQGFTARQGAGPSVQLSIPGGSITLDGMLGIRAYKDEVRVTVQRAF